MDRTTRGLLLATYTVTIFVSASLLFVVQPMAGKMLLPHLGGSSSVWTTCMLFFQTTLVAGYAYAHILAQQLTPRRQAFVHLGLMATAVATSLPFSLSTGWLDTSSMPALRVLAVLGISIGLPLFIVSSSAPLFQHWFSYTEHPDAEDPYYLYAASNVGSLLALFGYPFFVERTFELDSQGSLWAWGFGALMALTAACAWFLFREETALPEADEVPAQRQEASSEGVAWSRRGWWLLITFIPSSLMLGVTEYLTTDIASVPLLWVFPLGLYLLSFVLVFSRFPVNRLIYRAIIPGATLLVLAITYADLVSIAGLVLLHLWLFFTIAVYFHGELAADRPSKEHLTEFYIWMSVGGALGGLFNALVAPAIFDWMVDYYLVLGVALAVILPYRAESGRDSTAVRIAAAASMILAVGAFAWSVGLLDFTRAQTVVGVAIVIATIAGMGIAFPFLQNVGLAVLLVVGATVHADFASKAKFERSFFAEYTVYPDHRGGEKIRVFSHGTTLHGLQGREKPLSQEPIGYYHPSGPLGDIFERIPHEAVGIAGLGTGGMATYAEPGTHFTFYEIDPVVEDIAREHFTYLQDCGDRCSVQIGDARKLLEREPEDTFDLLFMDAYNSDSVPTHLLTEEALDLYMSRVDEDGVVVFHVSNRYLNVESIVGRLAEEAGLVARTRTYHPPDDDSLPLAFGSVYTVVARDAADLHGLAESDTWKPTEKANVLWTDQFTNIVSVYDW
jgi:spermidine synthase/type IV secretory pathway VirB3-like protein